MASGKRASMREGPLAALFRRTEEEGLESGKEEQRPAEPEGDEPREGRAPEPATAAAREREPGGETEESSPPTPTVPTPRERLRHAFSADIPENIMDPSASAAGATRAPAAPDAPTSEPPDAYARPGVSCRLRLQIIGFAVDDHRMPEDRIRPFQRGLILHTMYFHDEIRDVGEIDRGESVKIKESEVQLALRLIAELASKNFDPEKYDDEYRQRVLALVKEKAQGKKVTIAPPRAPGGKVIDLMDALKKSLEKRRGAEPAEKGSAGRKALAKGSRRVGEAARSLETRVRAGKR